MTDPRIEKSLYLDASPSRVWAFLTEPDCLARWFHPSDRALTSPGPYKFWKTTAEAGRPYCWGEVLEAEAEIRLVYTFTHEWLSGHETRVAWTLEAAGAGTRLSLVHDGFGGGPVDALDALFDHDAGWDAHFATLREGLKLAEPVV